MGQHRIYLSSEEEDAVRRLSEQQKMTTQDVIRQHIRTMKDTAFLQAIERKISRLDVRLEAALSILEILATEVGFTAGATRAATRGSSEVSGEGNLLEGHLKRVVQSLRRNGLEDVTQTRSE